MAYHIAIYKDNPVTGNQSGTIVSENDWTNAVNSNYISIPESSFTSGEWIKLAVRIPESGAQTIFDSGRHCRISLEGVGNTNWQLADDDGSGNPSGTPMDWGLPLDIIEMITDSNKLFHIRAKANSGENVMNETTMEIIAEALVGTAPPWTLDFNDMTYNSETGHFTNIVTVPEDCVIYIDFTGTTTPDYLTVYINDFDTGGYASSTWTPRLFNLTQNDTLKFEIKLLDIGYSDITIRLDDENGRLVSDFRYTYTGWILNFGSDLTFADQYTDHVTIPEACRLHFSFTGTSTNQISGFVNEQEYYIWNSNSWWWYYLDFNAGDDFYMWINPNTGSSGTLYVRETDVNGRIIGTVDYSYN